MSCTAAPTSGNGVPVTYGVRVSALNTPKRQQPQVPMDKIGKVIRFAACLELRSNQPMLVERLVYMPRNKERSAPCVCLELRSD
jgi:hypothetical protein